jgi:hypothetical protein
MIDRQTAQFKEPGQGGALKGHSFNHAEWRLIEERL